MKQLILIVASIIFSLSALHSQDDAQHQINLSGGSIIGVFKDEIFSPFNYDERGHLSGIQYSRSKNDNVFSVSFDFTEAELRTDVSDLFIVEENMLVNFSLDYLKKIAIPNNRFILQLGGQYKTAANLVTWDDLNAFTFNFAHSLGMASALTFQLDGHQSLYTNLTIPLVTLLVRPPYAGLDKALVENQNRPLHLLTNGTLTSVNKYFAFDWSFGYNLQMSNRWVLNLQYRLQYQHVANVHSYTNLQNQFTLGVGFKF